jgi:hypothetical protein
MLSECEVEWIRHICDVATVWHKIQQMGKRTTRESPCELIFLQPSLGRTAWCCDPIIHFCVGVHLAIVSTPNSLWDPTCGKMNMTHETTRELIFLQHIACCDPIIHFCVGIHIAIVSTPKKLLSLSRRSNMRENEHNPWNDTWTHIFATYSLLRPHHTFLRWCSHSTPKTLYISV